MATVEKISVALPPEMVAQVRSAVEAGEYASSSEVVREALREWNHKRHAHEQGLEELRKAWRQALDEKKPGVAMDVVMDRLKKKYEARIGTEAKRAKR